MWVYGELFVFVCTYVVPRSGMSLVIWRLLCGTLRNLLNVPAETHLGAGDLS